MERTLVTIFKGPAHYFRVRELAEDGSTVVLHWFGTYSSAVDYVDQGYDKEEMTTPDAFRAEVLKRKGGV